MRKTIEYIFRNLFPKKIKNYKFFMKSVKGLNGLEVGGPSYAFSSKGFLPIYNVIKNLDGCNFSTSTVWEGNISAGQNYKYGKKKGNQIIADGGDLKEIIDCKYDFILSCHSLEHMANPIKALLEWKRIIKNNSYILLILPHKDKTFDHNRPVTSLEHLIVDFENETGERDKTHFDDVISFHDLSMDSGIENIDQLTTRTFENFTNRCVHHHIFNTLLVVKMVNFSGFKICDIQHFNPFHIIILLQKTSIEFDNSKFLMPENNVYNKPQFPSDKIMQ